jgi:hypothetical protein
VGILSSSAAGRVLGLPGTALSPAAPRALTNENYATLEALGEVLLPGSARDGIARYVNYQLSVPLEESLLMIRYLGVTPPFTEFYKTGLVGVEAAADRQFGKRFNMLSAEESQTLVTQMAGGTLAAWSGPPSPLFYFVLRSDAIDVVYGTQVGFQKLAIPYMAHIVPPTPWGENG